MSLRAIQLYYFLPTFCLFSIFSPFSGTPAIYCLSSAACVRQWCFGCHSRTLVTASQLTQSDSAVKWEETKILPEITYHGQSIPIITSNVHIISKKHGTSKSKRFPAFSRSMKLEQQQRSTQHVLASPGQHYIFFQPNNFYRTRSVRTIR